MENYMKIIKYFKLLGVFYRRNLSKNRLMVLFMAITNLILVIFLLFFASKDEIVYKLEKSYLEHLSLDVSNYSSVSTNNSLINVKTYKRPDLEFLSSIMENTGQFKIRPDYSLLFQSATFSAFEKELEPPQVIIHNIQTYNVGINQKYADEIFKAINVSSDQLFLKVEINYSLKIFEEEISITFVDEMKVDYVYHEPTYLSSSKIYISQEYIDAKLGNYIVQEGVNLNNMLLNLASDHPMTNYRFKLHMNDVFQKQHLLKIINDISDQKDGFEVSSDQIYKVESFRALYSYLEILINVFLVFVIVGSIVIYVVIAHTSLLSTLKQMALLSIIGATKEDLYFLYLILILINFICALGSIFIFPTMLPSLNRLLYFIMHIEINLQINFGTVLVVIISNYLLLITLVTIIYIVNIRRPLLYLLLDA